VSGREPPPARTAFRVFRTLATRWMDNDVYGHINNVAYYSYFDTAVNQALIEAGVLDPAGSPVIGLVVETGCRYFAPLSFPGPVEVGLAVERLGSSSVTYALGVFRPGAAEAAAAGHFTHVYVDRHGRRPVAIPAGTRALLESWRAA
jgi:acyl-CoA thioester hydrolase